MTKIWNKYFIFILIINTLNFFSFNMTATILSKYLVELGTSVSTAGVIVGLFSITSLICRPFSGIMADTFRNVSILKASNIMIALGFLGFTLTSNVTLLTLLRILVGIGFAFSGTCQIALASKFIPDDKMGEGIGYLGLGNVLGSAVAPGLGLAIADAFGMPTTFFVSSLFALVGFLLLHFFHEPKKEKKGRNAIHIDDIIALKTLPLTAISATYSFSNGIIASYLVLFSDALNITGISVYFTVYALFLFLIRPLAGKLMDKKGLRVTVIPGLLLTALSMILLARSNSLSVILLTAILRAIGQGAGQPSLQAACIELVGKKKSGVATSTFYLGADVAQGFGPMIGGAILMYITGITGYRTLFYLCALLFGVAVLAFIQITKKGQNK